MKKYLIYTTLIFSMSSIYMIGLVWYRVSESPDPPYGHLTLRDNLGSIISSKGRSGGSSMAYSGSLDTPLVEHILEIEDARFWQHSGIDIRGKIASLWQNIQAGAIVRGGSTITEQYIKNTYYSGAPRTVIQKIRESIAAIILESRNSKETILRNYLSTVYMGRGLYGVQHLIEGDGESDTDTILDIITRLRYPNISDTNRDNILQYRDRVGTKIGKNGTNRGQKEIKNTPSIDIWPLLTLRVNREISLYCRGADNSLKKWVLTIPDTICESHERDLILTIDTRLMERSIQIGRGVLRSLSGKNVSNGSIYIIDPNSNHILAYIGSLNPNEEIDMITRPRSVGSLLKPFIYLLALRKGADAEDYLLDEKTSYQTSETGKYYIPENYNPKSYGPIRIREALGNSINTATVRLTDTLGISQVYGFLRSLGLALDEDIGHYGYGISLGTVETTMENIVDTYRSLTDLGDQGTWQIAEILRDGRNRAKTFGVSSILNTSIPQSVKTGTSTDFRDNWTISYSSDTIIGVWVGNTDGSSMGDISGVTGAGPIWHQITEYMIERGYIQPDRSPPPEGINQLPICLDRSCLRQEILYTTKKESPRSRSSEGLYFRSDFFGEVSQSEMEKWQIQQ